MQLLYLCFLLKMNPPPPSQLAMFHWLELLRLPSAPNQSLGKRPEPPGLFWSS